VCPQAGGGSNLRSEPILRRLCGSYHRDLGRSVCAPPITVTCRAHIGVDSRKIGQTRQYLEGLPIQIQRLLRNLGRTLCQICNGAIAIERIDAVSAIVAVPFDR
jgi:hypothetical protein